VSKFFIRRPIVAIVIAILTVIIGVVAMLQLPISQFPNIVPPEILVTATYPGADAKTAGQAVSTPIEQQMNGVDNMIYMNSVSGNNGTVQLFVDFDVKTDPNIDQVLAQLRVDQAQSQLPPQVTAAGLTVQKALTSPLSHQLRDHQPRGSNRSRQGSFARAGLRRRVCSTRLGPAG
jgi:HAE1 family hydrophobic/amphiphilic exporter-1